MRELNPDSLSDVMQSVILSYEPVRVAIVFLGDESMNEFIGALNEHVMPRFKYVVKDIEADGICRVRVQFANDSELVMMPIWGAELKADSIMETVSKYDEFLVEESLMATPLIKSVYKKLQEVPVQYSDMAEKRESPLDDFLSEFSIKGREMKGMYMDDAN